MSLSRTICGGRGRLSVIQQEVEMGKDGMETVEMVEVEVYTWGCVGNVDSMEVTGVMGRTASATDTQVRREEDRM